MMNVGRIIRTLSHIYSSQILYRIIYTLGFNKLFIKNKVTDFNRSDTKIKNFKTINQVNGYNPLDKSFNFLNKSILFDNSIEWNFQNFGKLWNYNLCYLQYLTNEKLPLFEINKIIDEFHSNYRTIKDGRDPYPTSLRIVNLVKLSTIPNISKNVDKILINDINQLLSSIEYHLLGNHLLENGFALYFAAHAYPTNHKLRNKALKILRNELEEQILNDGAHFERSLMYHQIILSRLLECISLSKSNAYEWNLTFIDFLIAKAEKMLGWLNSITENGQIFVRFNDSIEDISPNTFEIMKFSKSLGIKSMTTTLADSGFRKFKMNDLLLITNTGRIISDYQPGHSHANTFSFLLFYKTKPIIVDPGISTYENNRLRLQQRSTTNHNTININGINNNEVWSSFRVGRRAKVKIIQEHTDYLKAVHNGYSHINLLHSRSWKLEEKSIRILDELIGKSAIGEFNIHLHPEVKVQKISSYKILLNDNLIIEVNSNTPLEISSYDYAVGFNRLKKSLKIHGQFQNKTETLITIV